MQIPKGEIHDLSAEKVINSDIEMWVVSEINSVRQIFSRLQRRKPFFPATIYDYETVNRASRMLLYAFLCIEVKTHAAAALLAGGKIAMVSQNEAWERQFPDL